MVKKTINENINQFKKHLECVYNLIVLESMLYCNACSTFYQIIQKYVREFHLKWRLKSIQSMLIKIPELESA